MKISSVIAFLIIQPLSALTIQIDYTYDTSNFFNTQAKRDVMEACAKFYGDMIQDNLLRIDAATDFPGRSWYASFLHPATGSTVNVTNLVVPEDVVIIYVGARVLSGSTVGVGGFGGWGSANGSVALFNRIQGRGSAAADYSTPAASRTDFALWGGSISFDSSETWNFSQNQNAEGVEFVRVALHEMGHVLGIGLADSWKNLISANTFTGAAVAQSRGSYPPTQSGGGHFDTTLTSPAFGSFGKAHGSSIPVLMLPSSTDNGTNYDVVTDLDLAALVDIGWEIRPRYSLATATLGPGGTSFTWPSSSFLNYKVQRGTDLVTFPSGSGIISGNGSNKTWTDAAPPAGGAFYRLASMPNTSVAVAMAMRTVTESEGKVTTAYEPPRVVEDCCLEGD